MFLWKRPSRQFIDEFIAAQAGLAFSYSHVGALAADTPPPGFLLDEMRVELGTGAETYTRACAGLRDWYQFQLGWVEICWPNTPLEPGRTVGVLAKAYGLWSLNACRIIETIDETNDHMSRFGFVYGTLPDHLAAGEERFLIEWDHQADNRDGHVWYTIRAFSRPNHFLARVGAPFIRRLQQRFRQDSCMAMKCQCAAP
jgi:uncharacterized protein (UPF0548 family)